MTVCWLVINPWWFGGGTLWNIDKCFNNWHSVTSHKTSIFMSNVTLNTKLAKLPYPIMHKSQTQTQTIWFSLPVNQSITVMPNSTINCGFSSSGKLYSIDWQLGYLCFENIYQSHFQGSSSPINSTHKRLTTNLMFREQEGQNTSNGKSFHTKTLGISNTIGMGMGTSLQQVLRCTWEWNCY